MAAFDGRVLAISNQSDSSAVVTLLQNAKKDASSLIEIALHALTIDQSIMVAFIDLLRQKQKQQKQSQSQQQQYWDAVELINCRGRVEMAILAAMAVDTVQTLNLVRNIEMVGSSYTVLGTALQASTSLRHLRLTSTIGTNDAKSLALGLQSNTSLHVLEFRWSVFVGDEDEQQQQEQQQGDEGEGGEQERGGTISTPTTTTNDATTTTTTTTACSSLIELSKGLCRNQHLKTLDFFGCNLNDDNVACIASSLVHHPTLQSLILNGNKCGIHANEQIAAMLGSTTSPTTTTTPSSSPTTTSTLALSKSTNNYCCKLQKLDISFQRLDDHGHCFQPTTILLALRNNHTLITLDMTNNGLTDDDATLLSTVLCDNTTLQEVYLARNKIGNIGITAFAKQLPYMKGLKKLSLWGNNFDEDGAQSLLQGLYSNMILEDLDTFRQFQCSDEIQYYTNINRGGRKILQLESSSSSSSRNSTTKEIVVPLSLWSIILERANTVKLTKQRGQSIAHARADILFCLLRGPALLCRNFNETY